MTITTIPASALSREDIARWSTYQQDDPDLISPYFRPEFALTAAAARGRVEIAIIQRGGDTVGFFPFERHAFNIGTPVGGGFSDFHGVIARAGETIDPLALVAACRLNAWDFDHQLASQPLFAPFARQQVRSPCIDLARGFQAYADDRQRAGSQNIAKLLQSARKLEDHAGGVRFEPHSPSREILRQTLEWKSLQYRASGISDVFAKRRWAPALLERIQDVQEPEFAGMVSALYAGDTLVAGHVGMRSARAWHYWFPAYNPAYRDFSPGALLLLKMAEHAPAIGVTRIDLGKGEALYKQRFMNGEVALLEGRVECPSWVTTWRQSYRRAYAWGRVTPPARALRRLRHGPQ